MTPVAGAILKLAADAAVRAELPEIDLYAGRFAAAAKRDDPSAVDSALADLYIRLHSAGARYSPVEQKLLSLRSGYSCYPGGISPLVRAKPHIRPESITADLGAGNGLQGLLLQYLYPHRRTLLIELSAEMIRIGRIFQQVLGIGKDRVEWINDDIAAAPFEAADFIYLYRPAKPIGEGCDIYGSIARRLAAVRKPLVVFSVADCLGKFLDDGFSVFHTDGHLTCFENTFHRRGRGDRRE